MPLVSLISIPPVIPVHRVELVVVGEHPTRLTLVALPLDASGNILLGRAVEWFTSDEAIATVNDAGQVVPVNNGTCEIRAVCEGKEDICDVTVEGVTPPVVASVVVLPTSFAVTIGTSRQLQARAYTAGGKLVPGKTFDWVSSAPLIASVDNTGQVTPVAEGTATITATVDGISGSSAATVIPAIDPTVQTVTVAPPSFSLAQGNTQQLVATAWNPNGIALTGKLFSWVSSAPSIASVNSTGVVTALAPGSATITAICEGVSGTSSGTISTDPGIVATVTVSPSMASIRLGETQQFTATPRNAAGNVVPGKTAAWSSSAPSIVTVNASTGVAEAEAEGSASILAVIDGISGSAAVSVIDQPAWNTSTGQYVMDSNGALPLASTFDWPERWTGDAQWKSQGVSVDYDGLTYPAGPFIQSSGNRNTAACIHKGSARSKLIGLVENPDPAYGPDFAGPVFENIRFAENIGNQTPHAELLLQPDNLDDIDSLVFVARRAYSSSPAFTGQGNGNSSAALAWNATQNPGYKDGMYVMFYPSGRSGVESSNWTGDGSSGTYDTFIVRGGGVNHDEIAWGRQTAYCSAMRSGRLFDLELRYERWIKGGQRYISVQTNYRYVGETTWHNHGPRTVYTVPDWSPWYLLSWTGLNMNQARSTHLKEWTKAMAAWDADASPLHFDPMGSQAWFATQRPGNPSNHTIVSTVGSTVTSSIRLRELAGYVRARVDGNWVTGQDFEVPREAGAQIHDYGGTITWPTIQPVVTGLSSGSHTLEWFAVNKDKTLLSNSSSGSQTVTIS